MKKRKRKKRKRKPSNNFDVDFKYQKRKLSKKEKNKKQNKIKKKRIREKIIKFETITTTKTTKTKTTKTKLTLHNFGFNGGNTRIKTNKNFVNIFKTNKKYNLIYADPPWQYQKRNHPSKKLLMKANHHYNTMPLEKIKDLRPQIDNISEKNCILLLWATSTLLNEAFELIEAWGFKFVTVFMHWNKTNSKTSSVISRGGCGNYSKGCAEYVTLSVRGDPIKFQYIPSMFTLGNTIQIDEMNFLLLGKRGRIFPFRNENKKVFYSNVIHNKFLLSNTEKNFVKDKDCINIDDEIQFYKKKLINLKETKKTIIKSGKLINPLRRLPNIVFGPRPERHSTKPKVLYKMIENTFKNADKKIELFARNNRDGWECWGNECEFI